MECCSHGVGSRVTPAIGNDAEHFLLNPFWVHFLHPAAYSAMTKSTDMSPLMVDDADENHKQRGRAIAVIRWLESLRLPKALQRSPHHEHVPIIAGLERVCFGTHSAAEAVTVLGVHPPRYLCYMISGSFCDVIQFGIDLLLHLVFHLQDASLCWALGFGISVSFRHTTHRYLVFGDYVGGYWSSLGRMYAGYSIIIVLSTLFNIAMTKYILLPHYVAWIITLLWTGIVNYFILKKLWTFGGKETKDIDATNSNV